MVRAKYYEINCSPSGERSHFHYLAYIITIAYGAQNEQIQVKF